MKRLIILLVLGLAASGVATIGSGHGTALAQTPPGGGNANACARHAANSGNSYAYDLNCASLTITGTPGFDSFPPLTAYTITLTGSGLLPGSAVNLHNITSGGGGLIDFADGAGNFFRAFGEPCSVGSFQVYITGTTAAGTPIQSATVSMPPAGAC